MPQVKLIVSVAGRKPGHANLITASLDLTIIQTVSFSEPAQTEIYNTIGPVSLTWVLKIC